MGLLEVKSLMRVVVISSPEPILLTEVVYVQLLVIIGVLLEVERSVTPVMLQLQLLVFVTCGQLELLMLVLAVCTVHGHIIFGRLIVQLNLVLA